MTSSVSNPGIRKAAVLVMSLPKEAAGRLMAKLTPQQVQFVSAEIARTGPLGGGEQEAAFDDFATACQSLVSVARPFGFLEEISGRNLLAFIIDEHPQTIALILAHSQPAQAADVISGLSSDRRLDVLRRIASMRQPSREILRVVEQELEHRMSSVLGRQSENAGGARSVAAILGVADQATVQTLLEMLGKEAPDLVEEIQRLLENARKCRIAA
ncbi:MAG TPA: hypothetical protein VMV69_06845 [Pirellulales bacterium]|nr:hypothetical protein [Pirellulales bacterium]